MMSETARDGAERFAAEAAFKAMGLDAARNHAFLCIGPDCCAVREGLEAWEALKSEIKARRLPVLRTKAACLRVCTGGPWMVVYPEGVWYGGVTPERCRRIVAEHLEGGRPIWEWIAEARPLD